MRHLPLCFLVLLLASCTTVEPRQFVGPAGRPAYSLQCRGVDPDPNDCKRKAQELCPGGFSIIDLESGTAATPVGGSDYTFIPDHNLAIECKDGPGK